MVSVDSPQVQRAGYLEDLFPWLNWKTRPDILPKPQKAKPVITVYVAGPYTRPDPVENTHNTIKIADKLCELGYVPFIPHLTMLWHAVSPKAYQFWLDYDMHWLRKCDVLLRRPGDSSGADKEVVEAMLRGIPVVYSIDELESKRDELCQ